MQNFDKKFGDRNGGATCRNKSLGKKSSNRRVSINLHELTALKSSDDKKIEKLHKKTNKEEKKKSETSKLKRKKREKYEFSKFSNDSKSISIYSRFSKKSIGGKSKETKKKLSSATSVPMLNSYNSRFLSPQSKKLHFHKSQKSDQKSLSTIKSGNKMLLERRKSMLQKYEFSNKVGPNKPVSNFDSGALKYNSSMNLTFKKHGKNSSVNLQTVRLPLTSRF